MRYIKGWYGNRLVRLNTQCVVERALRFSETYDQCTILYICKYL